MATIEADDRTQRQRDLDEAVAAEPPRAAPSLPDGAVPIAVESLYQRLCRPVAISGVVENGLIRPLDPSILLVEDTHVIIVTRQSSAR